MSKQVEVPPNARELAIKAAQDAHVEGRGPAEVADAALDAVVPSLYKHFSDRRLRGHLLLHRRPDPELDRDRRMEYVLLDQANALALEDGDE